MIAVSYPFVICVITAVWILNRIAVCRKKQCVFWKREAQLLLVYVCLIVVARFTFFPFSKVDGKIQPLIFDCARWFPFRINLVPVVHLLDYPVFREAMRNLIGNTAMFVPLGIVWPSVYRQLDTHLKTIAAGAGFSLMIELLQLPFYDRVSDIDDLILNTLGYLLGYGIYLLAKKAKQWIKQQKASV